MQSLLIAGLLIMRRRKLAVETSLRRKTAELNERLRFEMLLSEISTRFVNLPVDQIDGVIEETLGRVCEILGVDLSGLWQFSNEYPSVLLLTHLYRPLGGPPIPERVEASEYFPWGLQQLSAGKVISVSSEDAPVEAARDKETWGRYGMKSILALPLSVKDGTLMGVLSFNTTQKVRTWAEPVVKQLHLLVQVFTNTLARKRFEVALTEAEDRLKLAADSAEAGIWELHCRTHLFWATDRTREIFGYGPDELISMEHFEALIHPDDLELVRQAIARSLNQGEPVNIEYRILAGDGCLKWILSRGRSFFDSTGKPVRLRGVSIDITKRKQAENELEERLRFERLISDLSTGFAKLSLDEVDSEIHKGLRLITEFFNADRCSIGLFSEDGTQLATAFDYHSADTEHAPRSALKEQLSWYMDQLMRGNRVVLNRVDDLPPEAQNERRLCLSRGMKSLLSIPLVSGGKTLGSCALVAIRAERVWPEHLMQRFQLISELFTYAIERKQAAKESQKSEQMLKQSENDLRLLAGRLIYNQEEERSRLARELHDDLVQRLAVFAIDIGKLEGQFINQPAPVQEKLREMKAELVEISRDIHNLSRQLHPSILDDLGLIKAVESECANFSRREGTKIALNHENVPAVIPKDISLSLYRIIQESLSNISKHACAEHVAVSLKRADHDLLLSVQDDGIGFDPVEVRGKSGLGLSSIRERVRLIQGKISIESQLEKGTMITVRVPLTLNERKQ